MDLSYFYGEKPANEMENKVIIKDLGSIDEAAGEFLGKIGDNRIIAFFAPMGAGKTTFTTALCHRLGVEDPVCSPTFTIVNEYLTSGGEPVYHFDFYRIDNTAEALDIGFYDYIDSGHLCLIEWAENIEGLLPPETLKVRITVSPDQSRVLSW